MGMPSIPAHLFTEAPQVDCCRPHGIPFDRALCPPDDAVTDALAAVAAEHHNARLECGLDDLAVAPADAPAGEATSSAGTCDHRQVDVPATTVPRPDHGPVGEWSMWDGARL